ncbi:MAG: hypothetical protein ACK48D_12280, partial [Pseudanabaena sp.]
SNNKISNVGGAGIQVRVAIPMFRTTKLTMRSPKGFVSTMSVVLLRLLATQSLIQFNLMSKHR